MQKPSSAGLFGSLIQARFSFIAESKTIGVHIVAMAEKILVVEDESLTRKNISEFLGGEGYEVREAANGADALEILNRERFSLVITDLVMPHVDGIRLVESIHTKWPRTSAVLLTAYLSARTGNMIMQGRAEVLTKPLDLGELRGTVERILASKNMLLLLIGSPTFYI